MELSLPPETEWVAVGESTKTPRGDKGPFTAPAPIQFGSVRGIQARASAVTKAAMAYVAVRHSSAHSRGIVADAARSCRPGFLANHPEWYHLPLKVILVQTPIAPKYE